MFSHALTSNPNFTVSRSILIAYVLAGLFLYSKGPGDGLPRLATSIASVIEYFASSRVVWEMNEDAERTRGSNIVTSAEERLILEDKNRIFLEESETWRYGFSKYVGKDGRMHVRIEQ